ncbi:MAG: ATP-binding cassette domain-containing protein, partial [Acidimicrobiales bacterium]
RQIRLTGGTPDVDGAIEVAALGYAIDRKFTSYSHGMRYRLAMAQALLGAPDLLLLDEPTTGMDPAQILDVHAAIAACAEAGKTVVLSSHQMSEVEVLCTHAAILRSGRLIASGSVAELIGAMPRVRLDIDDRDGGIAVLRALPGVVQVTSSGPGSLTVEGEGLRSTVLLEALQEAGLQVSGYRSTNFEDSYLQLFEADPPESSVTGPDSR